MQDPEFITLVGSLAATVSTTSFVPQAIKIIRTRDTGCISAGMYTLTVVGFTLWIMYGAMQNAWPLVASNSICLVLSAFILLMKLLPGSKKNELASLIEPVLPTFR